MTRTPYRPVLRLRRSAMAVALGILVLVLALRVGLVPGAADVIHRLIHPATHAANRGVVRSEIAESQSGPERDARALPREIGRADAPTNETFVIVERPPVLIGGLASLQQRIHYPEIAARAGIQGRVFLQFVVQQDGTPSDIVVLRGIGAGCDEEAVSALQSARFKPGYQRGEPVRVKMSLPVQFRLN